MAAEAMDDLADQYANRAVRSVFIYTREAHPGENYGHHTSMADKRRNAWAFLEHSKVRRQILLDDLEGTAHRAYGLLPNMTWIIGRGGFIHYKAAWTSPTDVADALEAILDFQANRGKNQWISFYSERSPFLGVPETRRDSTKDFFGLVHRPWPITNGCSKLLAIPAKHRPKISVPEYQAIFLKPKRKVSARLHVLSWPRCGPAPVSLLLRAREASLNSRGKLLFRSLTGSRSSEVFFLNKFLLKCLNVV